jgi:hypothetical protein
VFNKYRRLMIEADRYPVSIDFGASLSSTAKKRDDVQVRRRPG